MRYRTRILKRGTPRWPFRLQTLQHRRKRRARKEVLCSTTARESCVPGPPGAGLKYPNLTNGELRDDGWENTHTRPHTHTHTQDGFCNPCGSSNSPHTPFLGRSRTPGHQIHDLAPFPICKDCECVCGCVRADTQSQRKNKKRNNNLCCCRVGCI